MNKKFKNIVLQEIYLFHAKLSFIMLNWNVKRKKLGYLIVSTPPKRQTRPTTNEQKNE